MDSIKHGSFSIFILMILLSVHQFIKVPISFLLLFIHLNMNNSRTCNHVLIGISPCFSSIFGKDKNFCHSLFITMVMKRFKTYLLSKVRYCSCERCLVCNTLESDSTKKDIWRENASQNATTNNKPDNM